MYPKKDQSDIDPKKNQSESRILPSLIPTLLEARGGHIRKHQWIMAFLLRIFGVKNTHLSSNESVSRHALPAREGDVAEVFRVGPEQGAIPGERSARAYLGREERLGHSGPAVLAYSGSGGARRQRVRRPAISALRTPASARPSTVHWLRGW